jgi:hypothetical protein
MKTLTHPSTGTECRHRLLLLLLFSLLALHPAAAREPALDWAYSVSQLNRLAMAIGKAPEPVRADFAVTAISEMAAANADEAERARREVPYNKRDRGLPGWARTVDAYAAELRAIASTITPDTAVEVGSGIGPENIVYLKVAGKLVMVSSPRVRQQATFEQRVTERFCSRYRCEELIAEYEPPQPVQRARASAPVWSFSQRAGPSCGTDDGLEFQFRNTENLRQKRKACSQIISELNTLATTIARHESRGIRIDWIRLVISPLPGRGQHRVSLNGDGDSIQVPVPALAVTSKLFTRVRPWLAAKVKGTSYRLVVINADRLMAPLINPLQ